MIYWEPEHMLRTKAQEKTLCRSCPVAKAAHLVGDSRTLLIVRDLLTGPKRFSELQQSLEGISTRTLTLKLRELEQQELLTRKQSRAYPPHSLYILTKKGKGLSVVEQALRSYGKKYL